MKSRIHFLAIAAVLLAPVLEAAEATAPARFAAPNAAVSLPATSAGGIGQVTLALLFVLVAVFAVALLMKRLRVATGGGANGIEVLAQASLGAKERAVIIRVGKERLLLGVASGQVSLLQTLPQEFSPPAPPASNMDSRPTFTGLLKKSLGR